MHFERKTVSLLTEHLSEAPVTWIRWTFMPVYLREEFFGDARAAVCLPVSAAGGRGFLINVKTVRP